MRCPSERPTAGGCNFCTLVCAGQVVATVLRRFVVGQPASADCVRFVRMGLSSECIPEWSPCYDRDTAHTFLKETADR